MLRRDCEDRQLSFADLSEASRAVPRDHVLLRMKRAADWKAIEDKLSGFYEEGVGRPSWPPAVLVRMLVIEQFADLSDREVHEQVGYNLLYREFVGLGPEEGVPDDTTLVRFRARVGEEGVRKLFEELNRQWEAAGLVGSERRVVDGVHLWAKVARRSWVGLMRKGREVVVEAVAAVDPERAGRLRAEHVLAGAVPAGGPAVAAPEPRGEEALREESEKTRKLLEAVADIPDASVRARVEQVRTLLGGEGARVVSFDDPDARWGRKSEDLAFCGYKSHEALDPESRLITAVDVVPGNANEAVKTKDLLDKEAPKLPEGGTVVGDGLYQNATTIGQVEAAGARPCFSGLKAERVSDAFSYDAGADQVVCAQEKRSIGKVRVDNGDLYYFSVSACSECPVRDRCLTKSEREGEARRRVYLSDVRKRRVVEGEAGRAWRREQLRVRGRIEAKFWEQMNRHGLRRARYWGLMKVTGQVLWNAITVNLKRAAKLLARGVGPPVALRPAVAGA